MAKNLVIVESPAKAKTLKKFLGSNYKIEASMGHVRDLPKSELGISVENDFEPKYITIRGKGELLAKLRKEVKTADKIYLATDPDREGEAISWHLYYALKLSDKNAERITFNELTKTAVKKSIKEARAIDMSLVDAQQARRSLDRILGYKISPLLWKKVKKGLSAGRVQSVTVRIICDREEEIENFTPTEYWNIEAKLASGKESFIAKYTGTAENKEQADKILASVKNEKFIISEVKKGTRTRKPLPPFTTSTLQQEASKILNFATNKTMLIAQQLYEGVDLKGEGTVGLVSYIRTDSVRISDEAYQDLINYLKDNFSTDYINSERIEYKSKGRSQDAHEAIRPTSSFRTPDSVKDSISRDQYKLYKLIWERFISSQMSPASYDTLSVKITAGNAVFRSSGSLLKFDGYLAIYKKNEENKEEDVKIPTLETGEVLNLLQVDAIQHFTQAPPRYTEAMLVKTLEEIGVGRPSTYAPTISTILARRYVIKENKVFFPTELGEIVNEIMKDYFSDIVDVAFTAKMESDLDKIEDGQIEWKDILRNFYQPFEAEIKAAEEKIGEIEIEDEKTDQICENCGRNMVIKYGKFGKFLACPGFPECRNSKPLFEEAGVNCPVCGGNVLIKKTKKGRKYYGCDNGECGFMSWNKPTGEKCPSCGDILVEKGTKKRLITCVNNTCAYSREKDEE